MEEDLTDQLDLQFSDDESQAPVSHNKLLGAVAQLYEKKRVKAPTRKEPSLEVSEFHLSQPDKKSSKVRVTDLANVLKKRASHVEISQKLKTAQKKAKTLPKPLEKIQADKISRAAGYEHAKRQLNRWDAIVYKQRVAEQLTFPLKNETMKVYESTDLSKMFRKPTELEIKLAELLRHPNPLDEQKKNEKEPQREENTENNENDYPLSLAEVIEKRKMMAKLRAQESYRQAKAARHSKIKSKKFHQIQRKARVKEQIREFEELQKKDPEAALKKLDELERTRAEERVTLRHRSTGQWAKNLSVRAKYDKEARIALSEQLAKSRELTVKLAQNKDSESEKEEEEEEVQPEPEEEDPNNPWVIKRSKEMEDFVSGYRAYWQTKEKETHSPADSSVKVSQNDCSTKPTFGQEVFPEKQNQFQVDSKVESKLINNNKNDVNKIVESKLINNKTNALNNLNNINLCNRSGKFIVNNANQKQKENEENPCTKFASKFEVSNSPTKTKEQRTADKNTHIINQKQSEGETKCKSGVWLVSRNTGENKTSLHKSNVRALLQSCKFEVTKSNFFDPVAKSSSLSQSNQKSFKVGAIKSKERKENTKQKEKNLDELFEEVEDKLQNRIKDKFEQINLGLNSKRKYESEVCSKSESEEIPSLEMKRTKTLADVDEELLETPNRNDPESTKINSLSKTVLTALAESKNTEDIDPNKFLKVTPRVISSKLPDIMTEGDDALDDEETAAAERHLTISEAFAEDDVVDQFQKEKEEENKKNSVEDVNLALPGWGKWAGHNIKAVSKRKREKFVIKFPTVIRRDSNRGNVIINEDADKPIKEHQVSELPFPFTSVEDYEASIRAPIGSTWVPRTAHIKLTLPPVVTQLGAVIEPMDEGQLVKKEEPLAAKKLKRNRKKKQSVSKSK